MAATARLLAGVLTICASGLAACGGDDDGDGNGSATPARAESEEKIVIKTRMNLPTGEVVAGSSIGAEPFCAGGTIRDKHSENPEIGLVDRTVTCPDGSLRIGFTPREPEGDKQTGPWKVVSGTGAYAVFRQAG